MPKSKKIEKLPRLEVRPAEDDSEGAYNILIDGEKVDFILSSLEIKITPEHCYATFCIPLEEVDLDLESSEFFLKMKTPEKPPPE